MGIRSTLCPAWEQYRRERECRYVLQTHIVEQRRQDARAPERTEKPQDHAYAHRAHTLCKDQPHHVGRLCSEGNPDANLPRSARYQIRYNAASLHGSELSAGPRSRSENHTTR